jgi:hypothetical protein
VTVATPPQEMFSHSDWRGIFRYLSGMKLALYAANRMFTLLVGWGIAWGIGWLVNLLIAGAQWPIFLVLAAWWTYVAIKYVGCEAQYHHTGIDRRGG